MTNDQVHDAHKHTSKHRPELEASKECACVYCKSRYAPSEVREWIDEYRWERTAEGTRERHEWLGETALCPRCGIDSVLGDASGYELTDEFVNVMNRHWFGSYDEHNPDDPARCPLCKETAKKVGLP